MSTEAEKGESKNRARRFTLFPDIPLPCLFATCFEGFFCAVPMMMSDEEIDVVSRLQQLSSDFKALSSRAQQLSNEQQNTVVDALVRAEVAISEMDAALTEIEQRKATKKKREEKWQARLLPSSFKCENEPATEEKVSRGARGGGEGG